MNANIFTKLILSTAATLALAATAFAGPPQGAINANRYDPMTRSAVAPRVFVPTTIAPVYAAPVAAPVVTSSRLPTSNNAASVPAAPASPAPALATQVAPAAAPVVCVHCGH